ncbi:hypothetical protein [Flavobacterium crassostreae]|uniref:Uncharacterized protein n=1 Tax=Flavobacterium crassostreae TaxID=1763534 RepID=A0A1B9EA52_9FLAO|nr:hypothetical protein [Flavobacterium crassostreae]OCB78823.1 hypothetical protein LPBF_00090 [Flavobacterium crassostreae]
MKNNICKNCVKFNPQGYISNVRTEHLGFCSRFTQLVEFDETNCHGFEPHEKKQDYHVNQLKANKLVLILPELDLYKKHKQDPKQEQPKQEQLTLF